MAKYLIVRQKMRRPRMLTVTVLMQPAVLQILMMELQRWQTEITPYRLTRLFLYREAVDGITVGMYEKAVLYL